jgi:2-polyprenyl-3-methyl-5-hydroxy-6-metoxy-1,4-benzoquinol methylase
MTQQNAQFEFPEHASESRDIWNANATWWDDRIGDGNDFQIHLIEPATEALLNVQPGDEILDAACGAGRFARRMAELGATVTAFDQSDAFIERARERTPTGSRISYQVLDGGDAAALESLGEERFDKAVCTMALMDMPVIRPLLAAVFRALEPKGRFVFSVSHPCFQSPGMQRYCESHESTPGRQEVRVGIKVSSYLTPTTMKTEGIVGQPEVQFHFHRPLYVLLGACFEEGFVMDGVSEPRLPAPEAPRPGVSWSDMPDVPPLLVVRLRRP